MYTINQIVVNNQSFLLIENSTKNLIAKISLNEGARISELQLKGKTIIQELANFSYEDSYASAILFPFVSRIEQGIYEFEGKSYQLDCNQEGINALHGLVYNKTFSVVNQDITKNHASVTLSYTEKNPPKGFPFMYSLEVTYTLSEDGLQIQIKATNLDENSFPFTLGWHPYFYTEKLEESSLKFNSNQQISFDEKLITKEIIPFKNESNFAIKNKKLDDCFVLDSNTIEFLTPEYQLKITSNAANNYLQMYTPPHKTLIAIEPMTGISNSFNNKIGLQTLAPDTSYTITWNLTIY